MIIKLQSIIHIYAQKSDIWISIGTLELAIRCHLLAMVFKRFSDSQSNILCVPCVPFSSFSKTGIISGRQVYEEDLKARVF